MPSLTDTRFNTLRALGYTGSISDMMLAWLQSAPFGGTITSAPQTISDAWEAALKAQPTPPSTPYQQSDWWYEYLISQGYSGGRGQMDLQFWLDTAPP